MYIHITMKSSGEIRNQSDTPTAFVIPVNVKTAQNFGGIR